MPLLRGMSVNSIPTTTLNAINAIQQLQSDLGQLEDALQTQASGTKNGYPVDMPALEILLKTIKTNVTTDLQSLTTALQALANAS